MIEKEFFGKTIDEVIKKALDELDTSIDSVDIQIISEGNKGIFGIGTKQAHIKVTVKDDFYDDDEFDSEKQMIKNIISDIVDKPIVEENDIESIEPIEESIEEDEIIEEKISSEDLLASEPSPSIIKTDSSLETIINEFLLGLLKRMDIDGEIIIKETEDILEVNIEGKNVGKIIGYRGETLDAIQYILSLVLNRHDFHYKRIILDSEGYREKREQTLVSLANRIAERVRKSNRKMVLNAMKPYERRILHATLQNSEYVKTWSEGDEPNRRVVIAPKNN